jgi:hypothetical protein
MGVYHRGGHIFMAEQFLDRPNISLVLFPGEFELCLPTHGFISNPWPCDSSHPSELDELLRRRINRRRVTLASVIEKVEALAELLPQRPDKQS